MGARKIFPHWAAGPLAGYAQMAPKIKRPSRGFIMLRNTTSKGHCERVAPLSAVGAPAVWDLSGHQYFGNTLD